MSEALLGNSRLGSALERWRNAGMAASAAAGLVAGVTLAAGQATAAEKFIHAHPMTADHIFHPMSQKFMDKLKELLPGKFEVEYHPGGDLGDWTSLFEQVMRGTIPMSMTYGASEIDGRLDLSFLAFIVDTWAGAHKVFGPGGEMAKVFSDIYKERGMELIGIVPADFGGIAIRKGVGKVPTKFPADAKGIKMRVPPIPIGVKRFEAWGFSPVPMPFAELYTALQLGTVDARSFGPPVEIWQMRDVIETYIWTRDYFEYGFWLANKKWWDKRSAEEQKAIRAAADVALQYSWQEGEAISKGFLEKVKGAGIKVVELNAEELAAAKKIVYATEWPFMEGKVGKPLIDRLREIAGAK